MFIWPEPNLHFVPGTATQSGDSENTKQYFVFKQSDIFQSHDEHGHWQPLDRRPDLQIISEHFLGSYNNLDSQVDCYVLEVKVTGSLPT